MDPRIRNRIHTKISWIRNTDFFSAIEKYRYRMYQRTCEEVEETVFRWGPFGPEDFKKHLDQLMDFLKEKLPYVEFIWLTNPMGK
jgi:hypothetical protein